MKQHSFIRLGVCLLVAAWCLCAWPGMALAAKLGVFPLRPVAGLQSTYATGEVLAHLTDGLVQGLQEGGADEVVLLAWPEALATEDKPTFETLVGRGKEAGCNGVVALQVAELSFGVKNQKLPFVGTVTSADARARLTGGLIDVTTAMAVASVNAAGKQSKNKFGGSEPTFNPENPAAFDGSLLGAAYADACKAAVTSVRGGTARLTPGTVALPARTKAPRGVGFSQDVYVQRFVAGYDRRGTIAVVNRGDAPQSFVIKPLGTAAGLVVGLTGEGTMDGPCTLAPGQWKYVRLIVNAVSTDTPPAGEAQLGLYCAAAGAALDLQGVPQDKATLKLEWDQLQLPVRVMMVGQDPLTLNYTCRLINEGTETASLALKCDGAQAELFETNPELNHLFALQPHNSLTFTVTPHFPPGVRKMTVTLAFPAQQEWTGGNLEGSAAGRRLDLTFEVPEGKQLYYALTHSTACSSGAGSGCTNQGNLSLSGSGGQGGQGGQGGNEDKGFFDRQMDKLKNWIDGWFDGGDDTKKNEEPVKKRPPRDWKKWDDEHPATRGAALRQAVKARLPEFESDTSTEPCVAVGRDCWGAVFHARGEEPLTSVWFLTKPRDERQSGATRLTEAGHTGLWPTACADWDTSRAFVVWEDSLKGGSDLAFRASAPRMGGWQAPQYLTRHAAGVNDPVVERSESGHLLVAWEDQRSGSGQIYLRLSTDSGTSFAPEVALPRAEGEWQAWPQLAATPDERFVVVYTSKVGDHSRILSQTLDTAGKPVGAPVAVSTADAPCGESQIACDAQGRLFSVWREGEGTASEVWFASAETAGGAWGTPRALTHDGAYSEYPQVDVGSERLWVSYHSDISGDADLLYVLESSDGGRTWSEPLQQPGFTSPIEKAWVEINFSLAWPQGTYVPHDTAVHLNGARIGQITNAIPQGTYVFEVPPELVIDDPVNGLRDNHILTSSPKINGAHYIRAQQARLLVKRRYSQVRVVASSQAEADKLAAGAAAGLNHNQPDLVLAANNMAPVPWPMKSGQKLELALKVLNLGEGPAGAAKVGLYSADPRLPSTDLKKSRLVEQTVGTVAPGASADVKLTFQFDPRRTSRIFTVVQSKENDFEPADNVWSLSLTSGDSEQPTPLLGTDVPNLFYAPDLMGLVNLPNVPALAEYVSLPDFSDLASVRGWSLPDPKSIGASLKSQLQLPGVDVPDLRNLLPW
ncbi:MAG: hypothetical protein ABFE16_09715 [Armatimonadia bacterium]